MPVTELIAEPQRLRDFYDPNDFSEVEAHQEMHRVMQETAIERTWLGEAGLRRFATNSDIRIADQESTLERVVPNVGITPIWRLRTADPEYSPSLLRPAAHHVLQFIGRTWSLEHGQDEDGVWSLSVTSLLRSTQYQKKIASRKGVRKVAVDPTSGKNSSHEFGIAFDIDGGGLYKEVEDDFASVHPRKEHDSHEKIADSRDTLKGILGGLAKQGYINYCEELPGTQQWCFHVCANPTVSATDLLFGLRLPRA